MAKKGKVKAARRSGLTRICKLLSDGIKAIRKDILLGERAISAQERLIQQLIKQGAKHAVVAQARQRLKMLKSMLETDLAQLNAFEEEFAANC